MIVIEPPQPPGTSRRDLIRKRELHRFVTRALSSLRLGGSVSVLLTDDARIRQLNHDFRHKDKATDVLSFPSFDLGAEGLHEPPQERHIGDLAISLETAARQALAFEYPLEVELKVLLLHGLLHLAGFDHESDTGQMARKENRLRKELELPTSLIQRTGKRMTAARVQVEPGKPSRAEVRTPVATRRAGKVAPVKARGRNR